MQELEASYRKSKAPEMPQSMRDELNSFNSPDIMASGGSEEEDDALSYFQRLAEE